GVSPDRCSSPQRSAGAPDLHSFPTRRSSDLAAAAGIVAALERIPGLAGVVGVPSAFALVAGAALLAAVVARARTEHRTDPKAERSEEHTSELQSRFDLVCRLLLEKKKGTQCS